MCDCVRVGKGYSEEFEVKVRFTKAQYSAHCCTSLSLKPCHTSSALGSPGRTSKTLLSLLSRSRNGSGGS